MNKLEELILKEHDLKVGDVILWEEDNKKAKLKIVESLNKLYLVEDEADTIYENQRLTYMFDTPYEINITKLKTIRKNMNCSEIDCDNCPLTNMCHGIRNTRTIYEKFNYILSELKKVIFTD